MTINKNAVAGYEMVPIGKGGYWSIGFVHCGCCTRPHSQEPQETAAAVCNLILLNQSADSFFKMEILG